ncbi:hypothetical protein BX070DRAFT_219272, partial [Coemansia spiralis]
DFNIIIYYFILFTLPKNSYNLNKIMKIVVKSTCVSLLCSAALALQTGSEQLHSPVKYIQAAVDAHQNQILHHMYKRKMKEDPENPVAAAATDPNEAALNIKSRDLIPTNRPGMPSEIHHHRHGDSTERDDEDDKDESPKHAKDDDNSHSEHKKSSGNKSKASAKDGDDDDDDNAKAKAKDDDDSESHGQKNKDGKSKTKNKGLDGSEVDNEDGEDENGSAHKKVKVKHVKAKQRRWRTGQPKYNYKQALAGWKEVGPLYYYKGKYENAATSAVGYSIALQSFVPAAATLILALASYF